MLLAIPSPSSPFVFQAGPFHPRWYGVLLAVGVLVGGYVARREFRRRGLDPDAVYQIMVWAVPLGLIGARLYHVVTDWGDFYPGHLSRTPAIWEGGLGIWGAVLGGMLGVWIATRRAGLSFWRVADCAAPALALAQAIGRWGNYANQELYGKPSKLPWAVRSHPSTATRRTSTRDVPADVPLRIALGHRHLLPSGRVRSPLVEARPLGHRVRALRRALHRHPPATRDVEDRPADIVLGQRLNVWVSALALTASFIAFTTLFSRRTDLPRPGRVIPRPPGVVALPDHAHAVSAGP